MLCTDNRQWVLREGEPVFFRVTLQSNMLSSNYVHIWAILFGFSNTYINKNYRRGLATER